MAFAPNLNTTLFLLTFIVVLLPVETYAFGAGDIPDFAYLNDKAFRHGDIENILETVVKSAGGVTAGGGLLGFAHSVISQAAGGSKFSKSDIKKVYFGNWLRDYSQAMDIAGLSKLTADTLVLVVSILGFMTFGFATEEFQVTADRLGVYLPVEHIDNPKGYAAKEGDARQFHPKLRPPVQERELEFDERTGMKNYMATEDGGWDTSTAFIKRTLRACIEMGRRAGGREGAELWEAYRLLGTGLHTMEDLLAHSNWCEVALRKMGHEQVFCHVGENVIINTPNGPAPPLITGTFGGADFIHSLMGEATDKLSQASVTDLSNKMSQAQGNDGNISALKEILGKLPIGGNSDEKLSQGEEIHAQSKAYQFNPDDIAPPEVQQQLLSLLKWRDDIYRDILAKIEMVPGLADLIDELTNALNAYVYTVLSPYIVPILQQATGVLGEGSKAVIDTEDQFEVFNDPDASNPSHSFLSKDHFNLILNEPAGKIAQLVVQHSVNLIVPAWSDNSDPDQVIEQILEAFHHPYYATGRSQIQHQMFDHMERWLGGLGPDETEVVINSLTKESVRNGKNKRPGSEDEPTAEPGYGGHSHGGSTYQPPSSGGGYSQQGRYNAPQSQDNSSYSSGGRRYDNDSTNTYGGSQEGYRRSDNDSSRRYGGETNTYESGQRTYGESGNAGGYRRSNDNYTPGGYGAHDGESRREDYGSGRRESGREEHHRPRRSGEEESSGYTPSYVQQTETRNEEDSYSGRRNNESREDNQYGSSRYGGRTEETSYGSSDRRDEYGSSRGDDQYGSSGYGGRTEETSYGSSNRGNEYGSSGYSREDNQYGSSRHGGRTEETSYGSSRGDNQYGSSGYGGRTQEASYGSSNRGDEYGSSRGGDQYGSSGYGGRTEETSYESSNRGDKYSSYGENTQYSGGGGGYAPSYGSGRGNDDTFGAERLNIGGEDEEHEGRHGHGHHHGGRHRSHEED